MIENLKLDTNSRRSNTSTAATSNSSDEAHEDGSLHDNDGIRIYSSNKDDADFASTISKGSTCSRIQCAEPVEDDFM